MSASNALQNQVGGTHYKAMPIQPVVFIQANNLGFCEGNVVKYVCRWRSKAGVEDLRKAAHYLDLILDNRSYTQNYAGFHEVYGKAGMSPEHFCEKNGITNPGAGVIRHLWLWNAKGTRFELDSARAWMDDLLAMAMDAEQAAI